MCIEYRSIMDNVSIREISSWKCADCVKNPIFSIVEP
jgi:hypothetical protein